MSLREHTQKLRRQYDQAAQTYDSWLKHRQHGQLKIIETYLPAEVPTPIIDLGAGTGIVSKYLELDMISVDLSRQMLAHGIGHRCQADWSFLPFEDESFATVFSVSALDTAYDPFSKLEEMKRILKIGGYFYLTVLKTEDLALVESHLNTLQFDELRRDDALDAILFKGAKGADN